MASRKARGPGSPEVPPPTFGAGAGAGAASAAPRTCTAAFGASPCAVGSLAVKDALAQRDLLGRGARGHGLRRLPWLRCERLAAGTIAGQRQVARHGWHVRGPSSHHHRWRAEAEESSPPMPPRGGAPLTDADVTAVAAYVWAISHPNGK